MEYILWFFMSGVPKLTAGTNRWEKRDFSTV